MAQAHHAGTFGIELRHIRYFVAVAEELHFGRAAKGLHIVQPALSAQIKALESLLGVDLLERTKRRVELTEPGREFLRECYSILGRLGTAIDTVTGFARGMTGSLTLGYGANAALSGFVSSSIREFRSRWPNVEITLKEMPSRGVSKALRQNDIDIGFAAAIGSPEEGIASKTVGKWPWMLAVADNHKLATVGSVSVAQIGEENFAVYAEADGRANIAGALALFPGLSPLHIYKTSHVTSLMGYVSSGLGVAFAPSPMKTLNFPGVVFLDVSENIPHMEMLLLWRSHQVSPAVQNYLDCMERILVSGSMIDMTLTGQD
ncbi:LysR substrate-binding domain-containing protein [Neorhizobium sp. JUb45]|uniref:LysR family transcriptional regulator n=1 Tax=Neorhizobium sp. JUb45 TaxID=2485113 RepID=UPI0010478D1D|nr:LysR substrate-binding domain-containing protein [Neorhizobium sp. JUb45]TCQ99444.1 DNA-binding transcriptional LysR family regulator [Neorhizobium sp. JUb45]